MATEKSKIQEWPFAGLSRGHTVVCVRGDASACCAEWCACRVRGEAKFAVKRVKTPKIFPPPAGASSGLRASLRSLKSLMSSAHGQVLDLILEPLCCNSRQRAGEGLELVSVTGDVTSELLLDKHRRQ